MRLAKVSSDRGSRKPHTSCVWYFTLLFEPPHPIDDALILTFGHKVKQQLMPPKALVWRRRIEVGALTLAEWNRRFPDYPASLLS